MIRSADLPLDMAPVVAFEDRYGAGFVDPWHAHDRAQLSFALSGVLTVNTDDASFVLPPNRAVWIPPQMNHQTICRSEVVFQVIYIDPRFDAEGKACRVFEVSPLLRALIGEVATFDCHYEMEGREASIVRLLLDEVDRMPSVPVHAELPSDRRLRRVCEAILADPGDTRDIDYWAKHAGMARRTFTRSFREETGMGLATWRRQVRVMEAASRIAAGESITTVAYDVGYDSPSAFTAMFHRTFGATPSAYCRR
ncbi:helix-turn-helix transcriptional regulator [Sphingomonas sp. MG17]|jgi:AraC-like DNA-binding protein|uniref:Helix-turn-helix transcriptional regulator n=1 Tax=Sphingomonas tagetis TaxID=2949092 RepID=A0A9X2HQT8_9SPHN|nr:helix-turn-helix transcriptional regulator [Sphingomonas tagetis]MCP3730910.1 helix-turn-helix transcriptional regulator [Sphingomonas tagetis]